MDAGRLRFARLAAESALRKLASDDVFNIVHYDSVLRTWSSEHLPATPANIDSAIQYVRRLTGYSGNNVMSAMTNALIGHKRDEYVNSVVLLTDGETPIDHQLLSATNLSSSRVFVLGTGWGLNGYRLQRNVRDHNGAALFILRDTQFDSVASALFDLFRDPIIKNTDIRCAPHAIVSDWYPSPLPDIYQGQQFLMVGRYTTPGNLNVSVHGTNRNGLVSYDYTAALSDSSEMLDAIKTIWAKYRIDMMLLWMRIEPAGSLRSKEWYEEVVRLGITYGINTPFTARVAGRVIDQSTSVRSLVSPSKNTMSCSVAPNPLSDYAAIGVQLNDRQYKRVRVDIVDAYGNMVRTLHDQPADAGVFHIQWNGKNQEGLQVASGTYNLHITCDDVMSATNIVVVR
jgi:Ca-activated chloride channel family protein